VFHLQTHRGDRYVSPEAGYEITEAGSRLWDLMMMYFQCVSISIVLLQ